ncbi:CvpA family protein [Azospira inquinata]|uniref:CvpA family protein n=1 Tax=Azospira inquinata TaxID=2785627 RepID=A0A975SLI1_9RHOO|nr:CvpA family protein [Azospira inquinata]QWT46124.1 CvpA family protein [Azospira inquinata]QWT48547.1 CvpA family protein [Azospira inquinata]
MTFFDYATLAILAASLLLGLWRGVIGELVALLAWVIAFLAAKGFGPEMGETFFSHAVKDPVWRLVAGYVAVFVGVLILLALLRLAVQGLVKALGLSVADRFLGVLFGLGRGALIVFLLVAVGGMTSLPKQHWWVEAKLAPPFETAVLMSKPWLPETMAKRIKYR